MEGCQMKMIKKTGAMLIVNIHSRDNLTKKHSILINNEQ